MLTIDPGYNGGAVLWRNKEPVATLALDPGIDLIIQISAFLENLPHAPATAHIEAFHPAWIARNARGAAAMLETVGIWHVLLRTQGLAPGDINRLFYDNWSPVLPRVGTGGPPQALRLFIARHYPQHADPQHQGLHSALAMGHALLYL